MPIRERRAVLSAGSEMGSDTRGKLIETARELIHRSSFAEVSVDEVCRAAGVHRGSLYHFFPSKDALGAAVLERNWSMMTTLLDASFDPDVAPLERIDRFITAFGGMLATMQDRFGTTPGCPIGNLAIEFSSYDAELRQQVATVLDRYTTYLADAVVDAQARGEVDASIAPRDAAVRVVAYIQGLGMLGRAYDDPGLVERLRSGARALIHAPD